jgi:hypothetical protein
MRRALVGIVPDEVLNRKRKPFLRPESEKEKDNTKSAEVLGLVDVGQHMVSASMGIIDASRFLEALREVKRNKEEALMEMLARTLKLESWLRHLESHKILATPKTPDRRGLFLKGKRKVALSPWHNSSAS